MSHKSFHLVGMGILGSFLAWTLHKQGHAFTWEDNESQICAWKASTGLIYPSGETFDMQNYRIWERWCYGDAPWQHELTGVTETGAYWFISKQPPHKGKYPIAKDIGPLRLGSLPSFHLNGQQFVTQTRAYFASMRRQSIPTGSQVILSHGFTKRLHHYVWGWSVKVVLRMAPQIMQASPHRPMLYLRKGRFELGYAYLVPGEPFHYAGTSLIVQRTPKNFDIAPKFDWWKRHLATTTEGLVTIERIGEQLEGWRPAPAADDAAMVTTEQDAWIVRPLWSSGVRHAPAVCEAVLQKIREQ